MPPVARIVHTLCHLIKYRGNTLKLEAETPFLRKNHLPNPARSLTKNDFVRHIKNLKM
jgi:hypothetical protein